jgi:GWxTD domain-containing protein
MRWASRAAAALLALLALWSPAGAQPVRDSEDWADSPEAYFLTAGERAEWKALSSNDSRGAFKERYWLRRDPTPGTSKNEFRDVILQRIVEADKRWPIDKTPGSRTARGYVFVLFGTPARVRDTHADQPTAPRTGTTGMNTSLVPQRSPGAAGVQEGSETYYLWMYNKDRTPRILEALGLATLEIEFSVEPARRIDAIQNPGQVRELRDKLASISIVNPDMIPPGDILVEAPAAPPPPRPVALDPALKKALDEAPYLTRTESAAFGNAVVWRETGAAEALVWFHVPQSPKAEARFLHGIVRQEGGAEVASLSEPVVPSPAFSSADPGETILKELSLPPGTYEASFVVTEGASRQVASASTRLSVPDLSGFAVSSLLLTRGPGTRDPGDHSPFALGSALLPPRADATFTASESVWFFLELANPPDPAKATLEIRLRRGNDPMRAQAPIPANPQMFAEGRYLTGFELPLKELAPGDYRLYVVVRDGVSQPEKQVVRSADFRLKG